MRASRLSISGLMLAVVLIGLGLAALARPSVIASNSAFTVALASLGVATLGVVLARGPRRVGWGGYLFFAGGYLALSLGPWLAHSIRPHLITSVLLDSAYDRMSYAPTRVDERVWADTTGGYQEARFGLKRSSTPEFWIVTEDGARGFHPATRLRPFGPDVMQRLGHSVSGVAVGLLGAVVARWLARRERREAAAGTIGVDRPIDAGL